MSILHDNLLRLKILKELDKKTNDPAYYMGEKDLRNWLIPAYELHVLLKIRRDDYHNIRLMMLDRDEIGLIIQKGTEYIYLKNNGLNVLYGRRYSKVKHREHWNLLPAFAEALIRKVYLQKV